MPAAWNRLVMGRYYRVGGQGSDPCPPKPTAASGGAESCSGCAQLACELQPHGLVAAFEDNQPHLLALLHGSLELADRPDLLPPYDLNNVSRLETDAGCPRIGPHLQDDNALLVLDAELVGS